MQYINLTPHPVTLAGAAGSVTIAPAGPASRVIVATEDVDPVVVDGVEIPVTRVNPGGGQVTDLPAQQPGIFYIVSRMVAEAARRDDLYFPDQLVRDADGNVVGCKTLGRF